MGSSDNLALAKKVFVYSRVADAADTSKTHALSVAL